MAVLSLETIFLFFKVSKLEKGKVNGKLKKFFVGGSLS
jgi:hypothetical protein